MFGMKPTKNSGAGWIEKEDFQNDYILCQLKSTDAQSISIKKKDIDILEENAMISHKVPMFMVQFIQSDECFILCRPDDIKLLAEYLETKKVERKSNFLLTIPDESSKIESTRKVKSASKAREEFYNQKQKEKGGLPNGRKGKRRSSGHQDRNENVSDSKNQIFWS